MDVAVRDYRDAGVRGEQGERREGRGYRGGLRAGAGVDG